jgi:hypothetical protein
VFNAKVRADGRFFRGAVEVKTQKFAQGLESGKEYFGVVFDSQVGQTHYVEYDRADFASFASDELESLPGEFMLICSV